MIPVPTTHPYGRLLRRFANPFARAIEICIEAGYTVRKFAGLGTEVENVGESHRAVSGEGDAASQEIFGQELPAIYPDAKILVEEPTNNRAFVSRDNPVGILQGTGIVGDPADGTTMVSISGGLWCAALGTMLDGVPTGSILFAPGFNGGLLLASQKNFLVSAEWNGEAITIHRQKPLEPPLKKSAIWFGTDPMQYPALSAMFTRLTAEARVVTVTPSGLLGLAMVAMGRFGAVIQTPQRIWDIVPLLHALQVTGMQVRFYRIDQQDKCVRWLDKLDFEAFCYARPNRVGLIAGNPSIVPYLAEQLEQAGPLLKVDETLKD